MSVGGALEGFFHGPQAAVRPYLITRAMPLMLALDAWMLMIGHAGRYGVAGFNVAHFAWLDRMLPVPTAAGYIALLLVSGLLAIYVALTGVRLATTLALFVCYTLSWAISMLDSYQHHYFMSLVLLCLCAFPRVSARDLSPDPPPDSPSASPLDIPPQAAGRHEAAAVRGGTSAGFGYPLLACTIAIVYLFAALAKWDPQWLDGYTIRRISRAEVLLEPVLAFVGEHGVARERAWAWLSTVVIPMEVALGLGYVVASQQDRVGARWLRGTGLLTLGLAVALHVGAELMELEIGWFSYYMLLFALVYAAPRGLLATVARPLVQLEARVTAQVRDLEAEAREARGPLTVFLMALGVAALLWVSGRDIDLPGAATAVGLGIAALLAVSLYHLARGTPEGATGTILATAVAVASMWLVITASDVRWDFYRYLGGDLARRGHPERALTAYLKGEPYAPPGQSRRKKIDRLRQQLGKSSRRRRR